MRKLKATTKTPYQTHEEQPTWVYALVDPRTSQINYVGHSRNPHRRLLFHVSKPSSISMRAWIGELKQLGLRPIVVILEPTSEMHSYRDELKWIRLLYAAGAPLRNYRPTGTPDYRSNGEWELRWTRHIWE